MEGKKVTDILKESIEKYNNKDFGVFFFVYDSKGTPMGSLAYIYDTAYKLHNEGYNVKMLHADNDFVGVESWLGEKYASLPHFNINPDKDPVSISAADILFIPDVCVNVMTKTKALPCKRVAIIQNFSYLTEMMPMGVNFSDLKINECITTSNKLAQRIDKYFPYMNIRVVRPSIPNFFFEKTSSPKKLIINVVSKDKSDLDAIMKPFYWKYPQYAWVSFLEVKNLPMEDFAKTLKEGIATLWLDTKTDFGYSALEAMACDNIVIGKIPENVPDWIEDENGEFISNGIWFFNNENAQDLIAGAIQNFLYNNKFEEITDAQKKTIDNYTDEKQKEDIDTVYVNGIFEQRKKELEALLKIQEENNKEEANE